MDLNGLDFHKRTRELCGRKKFTALDNLLRYGVTTLHVEKCFAT